MSKKKGFHPIAGTKKGIQQNVQGVRTFCGEVKELADSVDCKGCLKRSCTCQNFLNKFPIIKWLPKYRCPHFQGDLIAGLTVGLTVIPQGLAYAQVAELPPQFGLYSAFMGCFVYMIFGTSKDITLGPTAIMSLMTAEFAHTPIAKDPTYAVILSLGCGVLQLLMGLLSLGFLVDFIPYPVINAFTTSAAITIAVGQIKKWLGLKGVPRDFLHQLYYTCKKLPETKLPDFGMGLVVMIVLYLMKKVKGIQFNMEEASTFKIVMIKILFILTTARNAIVIAIASGVAAGWNSNQTYPFTLTGNITGGLPEFGPPALSLTVDKNGTVTTYDFLDILGQINFGLAIVPIMGVVESIAIGNAFARKNNYKIDSNQELIAIGAANLVGAFAQAYPVTGSFSRTAVNSQSGVKTPAGGLFTGGLVLLALAVLTPMFFYIPDSALAGVIIMAVLDMASFYLPKKLWKIKKIDLLPWFVTFIFSFVLGIEFGIILGVLFSLLFLMYPWARPRVKMAKDAEEGTKMENYGVSEKEVCIIKLDQGLRFPGVEYVRQTIMNKAAQDDTLRPTILDCSHIADMDYSSVQCIQTLVNDFAAKGSVFIVACPRPTFIDVIRNAEIKGLSIFDSVQDAVDHVTAQGSVGHEDRRPSQSSTPNPEENEDARLFAPGPSEGNNSHPVNAVSVDIEKSPEPVEV